MALQQDPNSLLDTFLNEGTEELRQFVQGKIYNGSAYEIDRVARYQLFWKFYQGQHYKDFNDGMLSMNYVKAFIDKVNQFLLGDKGFSFKVTSLDNDVAEEEVETAVERLFLYVWRRNKNNLLAHEILQMGSICGDVWLGLTWWKEYRCPKIQLFDSRYCFPKFENGNFNRLESFTVRTPLDKNPKYKLIVTEYTNATYKIWYQTDTNMEATKENSEIIDEGENPLGFIPVVHIKNRPNSASYYSTSDANDILKLNKIYNEINQEIKHIIDYYTTPVTVVTGATLKNAKRTLGNIWSGLPPEANVFTLGLDADLSSATQFAQNIKTAMHEISDVPENVLGKIQSISGTSAATLKLTYQPLVQQADLKALTYGEGITELNEMILKMYAVYDKKAELYKAIPDAKDFNLWHRVEPIFAYGFPTDRMNQLQEMQIEGQLGLGSKREFMNRLGKNNVPDLLEEIKQEQLDNAELQAMLMEISGQNNPTQEQQNVETPLKQNTQNQSQENSSEGTEETPQEYLK